MRTLADLQHHIIRAKNRKRAQIKMHPVRKMLRDEMTELNLIDNYISNYLKEK
jgi:hypothetical protein